METCSKGIFLSTVGAGGNLRQDGRQIQKIDILISVVVYDYLN
jgi:hypothetical protein